VTEGDDPLAKARRAPDCTQSCALKEGLRALIATPRPADIGGIRLPALISTAAVAVLAGPVTAASAFVHMVEPGESLSSVAVADGLSVEQLAAANGLPPEASLLAGTSLVIPPQEAGAAGSGGEGEAAQSPAQTSETGEARSSASGGGSYVVQPGDTLSGIAQRAGMSVEALAAANGLEVEAPLLSGTVLRLSSSGSGEGSLGSVAGAQPEGAEATGSQNTPPYPTEETIAPSEVGAIAEENGVSASLAEAVADEESGFNNGLTSSADARGVMQILPGTWSWIGESLTSSPLDPASATSNVRGGVLMLHSLLESSGGNPELAVAGYYQGLPSVLEEGELPETEQYVAEVMALRRNRYGGE
jgi:LysM repeat protein